MHTTILETERLLLRPFRETDLQELFECCQNPNLGNNAGWEPHKSIEDSKEVLHTVFMGNEGVFAIILKKIIHWWVLSVLLLTPNGKIPGHVCWDTG